jgi:prepilin-type processing-associated H-X9-DG protein
MQCTNNLKQLGIAVHNFHDIRGEIPQESYPNVFKELIFTYKSTATGFAKWGGELAFWGYLPQLAPFMEQNAVYENIVSGIKVGFRPSDKFSSGGDYLPNWSSSGVVLNPQPNIYVIPTLLCPSEPNPKSSVPNDRGRTNYWACIGDVQPVEFGNDAQVDDAIANHSANDTRGAFVIGYALTKSFASVSDGLSNSLFISEGVIASDSGTTDRSVRGTLARPNATTGTNMTPGKPRNNCLTTVTNGRVPFGIDTSAAWGNGPGKAWTFGGLRGSSFITAVSPNGPSCNRYGNDQPAWAGLAASSFHSGGVNAVFGDGAVRFVPDTINALSPGASDAFPSMASGGESPWGIWGAIGTIACGETKSL